MFVVVLSSGSVLCLVFLFAVVVVVGIIIVVVVVCGARDPARHQWEARERVRRK